MAHFALDSDDDSVIHQDSDDDNDNDDVEHDDDVDIGFRRHQYETFDDNRPSKRRRRGQTKEDAIYGVFMEDDSNASNPRNETRSRKAPSSAPVFVAAKKEAPSSAPAAPAPSTSIAFQPASKPSTAETQNDKNDIDIEVSVEKKEEESLEEKDIREKQKAADDHFHSLMNQAKGKRRRPPPPPPEPSNYYQEQQGFETSQFGLGLGLGMMPMAFGEKPPEFAAAAAATKKDPSIAKWEKHTKSFGSKLLAKMGWKGSGGLGSNRRSKHKNKPTEDGQGAEETTQRPVVPSQYKEEEEAASSGKKANATKGISRPVEVVVRPANLGLGFGNFKEASRLKTNRQIEAEVKGVELESEAKTKDKKDSHVTWGPAKTASSALPTTSELLSQKSWKRMRSQKSSVAPKVIPYTELLAKQQGSGSSNGHPVIIDMRGPAAAAAEKMETTTTDGEVPLGEELLHNISFLLNTHENKLHSCSHFVKSAEQKVTSLASDVQELKQRETEGDDRIKKLEQTLLIVDQVENLTQHNTSTSSGNGGISQDQEEVQRLIQQLGDSFTGEERQSLKFWETLAPTLLSPVIQKQLDQWDPLGDLATSKTIVDSIFNLNLNSSSTSTSTSQDRQDKEALRSLRYSIIRNQLVPRIKQLLESSRWNPSRDTDVGLDLYEYLHQRAVQSEKENGRSRSHVEEENGHIFPAMYEDDENNKEKLSELLKKDLIIDTVHPKLQAALSHWKPTLREDNSLQLEDRLDLWILPWVPHMDHPAILPNMLSDCKRKVKSAISYLHRKISHDDDFVRASLTTLKPWQRVFDRKVFHRLVSQQVTPSLARCLSKQRIRRDPTEQNWTGLRLAFEMHGRGLLSDQEFLSVIEGELLTNWAAKVHDMLLQDSKMSQVATIYREWKLQTLLQPMEHGNGPVDLRRSLQLLQEDVHICGIFYSVLRMIQLANSGNTEELEEHQPPKTNFQVVSARRANEQRHQVQEDFVRMESRSASETEARIRLRRRNVHTPTFKDVVEEFANERGILFRPRMVGAKSLKDGKQVFLFGGTSIYMEGGVIYASKNSDWKPTSLDRLAESVTMHL
jgi:tuftelin-interacting protein 11